MDFRGVITESIPLGPIDIMLYGFNPHPGIGRPSTISVLLLVETF